MSNNVVLSLHRVGLARPMSLEAVSSYVSMRFVSLVCDAGLSTVLVLGRCQTLDQGAWLLAV